MKMKKIMSLILGGILLLGVTGCGNQQYSENIRKVRDEFNPWQLETEQTVGILLDRALKEAKWEDNEGVVTVTGKDNKTGEEIKVTFEVKEDNIQFVNMERNNEDNDYFKFFEYIASYSEKEGQE